MTKCAGYRAPIFVTEDISVFKWGKRMLTPRELVESFYADVWNQKDEAQARRILSTGLEFRGSLDDVRTGVDGFLDYARLIHTALEGFTCTIGEMMVEGDRVATRMAFHGIHRGEMFGAAATRKRIEWAGAGFFGTADGQIHRIWVLGDVDGVKRQLGLAAVTWTT
jgi:predicted ester cyclase